MNQPNLTELVTDLHTKPDVVAIHIMADQRSPFAAMFLPPDRVYNEVNFGVLFKTEAGLSVILHVIDCTSPERATLFVERWKAAVAKNPKDKGLLLNVHSSGQFVVMGDEASVRWIARFYRLR